MYMCSMYSIAGNFFLFVFFKNSDEMKNFIFAFYYYVIIRPLEARGQ